MGLRFGAGGLGLSELIEICTCARSWCFVVVGMEDIFGVVFCFYSAGFIRVLICTQSVPSFVPDLVGGRTDVVLRILGGGTTCHVDASAASWLSWAVSTRSDQIATRPPFIKLLNNASSYFSVDAKGGEPRRFLFFLEIRRKVVPARLHKFQPREVGFAPDANRRGTVTQRRWQIVEFIRRIAALTPCYLFSGTKRFCLAKEKAVLDLDWLRVCLICGGCSLLMRVSSFNIY